MVKLLRFLMLLLVVTFSLTFVACGGGDDEPDNPINSNPNIPDEPDEPSDDAQKYDIIGVWENYYLWTYSGITEHTVLDIKTNGTLSYSVTKDNGSTPSYGSSKWTYQNNSWTISTSNSLTSGTYVMVNGQLVMHTDFADGSSRTVIFNRKKDSDEPNEQDYKSSDFIGKWYDPSKMYVYNLKQNGKGETYALKGKKSDKYTEKYSCTWSFNPTSSLLTIQNSKGIVSETVSSVELPYGFRTSNGTWDVCSKLPSKDSGNGGDSEEDGHKYSNYYTETYGNGKTCCEIELTDLHMGVDMYAGGGNAHIKYIRLFDKNGKGILSLERHYDGATIPSNDRWDAGTYDVTEVGYDVFLHNPIILIRPHSAIQSALGKVKIQYVGNQIIFEFEGYHSYNEHEKIKVYFKSGYSK